MNFLVRRVYAMWRIDIIVLLRALIKIDDILRIIQKQTFLMTQFRLMCLFGFLITDERSQIVDASLWKSACAWDHYDHDIWCIINHWYLILREAQLSSDEHKYLYSKQPKTNHRNVKCIFNLLIFLLSVLFDVCFRFFRVLRFLPLIDFNDCERSFIFFVCHKVPMSWITIVSSMIHNRFSFQFELLFFILSSMSLLADWKLHHPSDALSLNHTLDSWRFHCAWWMLTFALNLAEAPFVSR